MQVFRCVFSSDLLFIIRLNKIFRRGRRRRAAAGSPTIGRAGRSPENHAPPTREAGSKATHKRLWKTLAFLLLFSRDEKRRRIIARAKLDCWPNSISDENETKRTWMKKICRVRANLDCRPNSSASEMKWSESKRKICGKIVERAPI